jgi:BirA family biotin operon repressor/biotin-[acetyl-CoA-carboxylase] ligase
VIPLDKDAIRSHLKQAVQLVIFDSIPSTNDYLKNDKTISDITVCLAESQTKGRGRLGRAWYSPAGYNIYLSCAYPFQRGMCQLSGLSLVVGLSIYQALRAHGVGELLSVKWPNDVLYDGKKIAGILIETEMQRNDTCIVIIGIGLNVNMQVDHDQISQDWTSLSMILGCDIDRNVLCADLINQLLVDIASFQEKGFSCFHKRWQVADGLVGKMVRIEDSHRIIAGKVVGVDASGCLLVDEVGGGVQRIASGSIFLV